MYKKLFLTCIGMVAFMGSVALYAENSSVTINYGTVESIQTITKDSKHAGGALAGGVIGAMIGPRRHRGIRVLAGAGIGVIHDFMAVKNNNLVAVLPDKKIQLAYWTAWHESMKETKRVSAVADFLDEIVREDRELFVR